MRLKTIRRLQKTAQIKEDVKVVNNLTKLYILVLVSVLL